MTSWEKEWDEVIAAVGTDFSDGTTTWGADAVERGTIRRYCEPLELGAGIHHDPDVARSLGHSDVVAPYTSILSYTLPAMWGPGEDSLFDNDARDAQPTRSPINNQNFPLGPVTTGYFATDLALDFVRPLTAGDRVGRRGRRLISCLPKETAVGKGAFMTWESELVERSGELVALMSLGTYAYQPHAS